MRSSLDAHASGIAVNRMIIAPPLPYLGDSCLPDTIPRRVDRYLVRGRKSNFRRVRNFGACRGNEGRCKQQYSECLPHWFSRRLIELATLTKMTA